MKRNAYAAKIQMVRSHLKTEERAEIVNRVLTTVYQSSAVALNEQFGFGADRIARFRDAMEKVIMEYGDLQTAVDADYADGKLAQRYEQIMGDAAYPEPAGSTSK